MQEFEVLIPQPIGEVYCHRIRNGKFCMEHHESEWIKNDGMIVAHCESCGRSVRVIDISVSEFLKDDDLINRLLICEYRIGFPF